MTDERQIETPSTIPAARATTWPAVTKIGNSCIEKLTAVVDQGPEKIVETIKMVMPELLQATVECAFSKSKLWPKIDSDKNLEYYTNLDVDSWLNPGDLNASELRAAQVSQYFRSSVCNRLIQNESSLSAILKNTEKCVKELEKCKVAIRSVQNKQKDKDLSIVASSETEKFRKAAGPLLKFVEEHQSKLIALLQGERDSCPNDLGKTKL